MQYKSGKEMVRAIDSIVVGSVARDGKLHPHERASCSDSNANTRVMLFTGLVVRFVFGTSVTTFMNGVWCSFGHAALIGFAGLVLIPIAALLALVSVLGAVIGITIIFAYVTLLIVSWSLSGLFLGGLLSRYATGTASYGPLWIILGTLTLYATTFIPGFGHILALVVMLMVLGGFLRLLYARYR